MVQYAIVQLLGKQYKVSPGDSLVVDRVTAEAGKKLEVIDVLLIADGDKVTVGQPTVAKAKVTFTVGEHSRSKKLRVAKFKAKSRYRRVKGHRQSQSTLTVEKIVG